MEDTSPLLDISATTLSETTASPAVIAAEEDQVEFIVDEHAATDEADKLAGQAGGEVETSKLILPNELVDHVLFYLDHDDYKSALAACCRVSRTFLLFARHRLYRNIAYDLTVSKPTSSNSVSFTTWLPQWHLYHTLLQHQALSELVEVLTVYPLPCGADLFLGLLSDYNSIELLDEINGRLGERWLEAHRVDFGLLLKCCRNIKEPTFAPAQSYEDVWPDYSFFAVCLDSVVLTKLRKVTLPAFYPKVSILAPFLVDLEVEFDVDEHSQEVGTDNDISPTLQVLTIGDVHRWQIVPSRANAAFEWLTHLSHNRLTSLSLFYTQGFHPRLDHFRSLASLEIILEDDDDSELILWTIPSFLASLCSLPSSLNSLTVHNPDLITPSPDNLDQTFLASLPSRLKRLSFDQSLFRLHIWRAFISKKAQCMPNARELVLSRKDFKEEEEVTITAEAAARGLNVRFSVER